MCYENHSRNGSQASGHGNAAVLDDPPPAPSVPNASSNQQATGKTFQSIQRLVSRRKALARVIDDLESVHNSMADYNMAIIIATVSAAGEVTDSQIPIGLITGGVTRLSQELEILLVTAQIDVMSCDFNLGVTTDLPYSPAAIAARRARVVAAGHELPELPYEVDAQAIAEERQRLNLSDLFSGSTDSTSPEALARATQEWRDRLKVSAQAAATELGVQMTGLGEAKLAMLEHVIESVVSSAFDAGSTSIDNAELISGLIRSKLLTA